MQKLIENNLFGDGLVPIDKPHLVERYNNCLKDIGIKTTSLTFFHIDKWGWCPEIANEFQNKDYLCFGYANPFGIIISPEQKKASIYHPFYSFDWELMDTIFDTYSKQINDITTQFGLWFEADQELSTYRKPQDLLLLENLNIKFYTPAKIINIAKEQKKLVKQFYDERNAWADQELHAKILESATQYGDLRNRSFEMNPLPYAKISSFYTGAFHGLFVFRSNQLGKTLLIFEDNSSTISGELSYNHLEFNLNDPKLMEHLKRYYIIQNDLDYFKTDVFSVMNLRDTMLMNLVTENYPDEQVDLKVDRLRSKYINMLSMDKKLPDEFYALEEIIAGLKRNATLNIDDYPEKIKMALSYPNPKLTEENKKIVWTLIMKTVETKDVLLQYLFDKNQFFADYSHWSDQKQDWAIELIKEQKHHMYNYKITKS